MSNEQKPNDGPGNELVNSLSELAQQIEAVVKAAVNSDRVKDLQEQVSTSVRQLASSVETSIKNVQADPRVQQAEERGREAWEQIQQQDVVKNVQETLATGIAQLNERLKKLAEGLEKKDD